MSAQALEQKAVIMKSVQELSKQTDKAVLSIMSV